MNFEEIVVGLKPLFESHGFKIIDKGESSVDFHSDKVSTRFAYDWRDKSISFFVGKINGAQCEINDENLKDVFNHKFDYNNNQSYLQNILDFLNGNGKALLMGDESKLTELENHVLNQAKIYTANLILSQNKALVDKAWTDKNYEQFLEYINLIDPSQLPNSYLQKYKIAIKHLKNNPSNP